MTIEPLAIYKGSLSHSRFTPVKHSFRYRVFQIWVDINQPSLIDSVSRWWSTKHFNLVRFDRRNYMPSKQRLHDEVCAQIKLKTGQQFDGQIYLLTNLSYWGHCYNPVSFYACYQHNKLYYFIAEIENTPWGERFCYVHQVESAGTSGSTMNEAFFDKQFHVSPFMPMDLKYQWKYKISPEQIKIIMNLSQNNETVFNASLNLKGQALTTKRANWLPFIYPIMCLKTMLAIYWQAVRLWLKKVPFYSHPNSKTSTNIDK